MARIPKSERQKWTREETLLAMNLYCRIPFGQQDQRNHQVIELAQAMGRTPGSVAMKLNNLTSLDPAELNRVSGLRNASRLDQQVWDEFHADWAALIEESDSLWSKRVLPVANMPNHRTDREIQTLRETAPPYLDVTEGTRPATYRIGQDFFRQAVLAAYERCCCISGNPVPKLLIASHIVPWKEDQNQRLNPRNGLCLSRIHDAAFDQHLITFDEQNRLVLSKELKDYFPNDALQKNFKDYEGKPLKMPRKFAPDPKLLETHRETRFRG